MLEDDYGEQNLRHALPHTSNDNSGDKASTVRPLTQEETPYQNRSEVDIPEQNVIKIEDRDISAGKDSINDRDSSPMRVKEREEVQHPVRSKPQR